MKVSLKEKSTYMVKVLHALDCTAVAAHLMFLVMAYRLEWQECYSYLMGISAVLAFFVFSSFQLYRSWRGHNLYHEFLTIIKAWSVVVGILLFLSFLLKVSYCFSRVVVLAWFFSTPLIICLAHILVRLVLRRVRRKGGDLRTAVVIGAGDLGLGLAEQIDSVPWSGIRVVGFFDDYKNSEDLSRSDKPVLGTIGDLADYLQKHAIDYIYIALPMRAEKKILNILSECRTLGAQIYLVPDLYLFRLFNATIETLGDTLLLNFNPYDRTKRYFDICFSLFVLIVAFPLMLIIALAVKLQDGGPVFYLHKRITSTGKPFQCFKFRTMCVDADKRLDEFLRKNPAASKEWKQCFKLRRDPRVTPLGRFLRITSLDELPQFMNVLKGDMSVVGARPIVATELDQYYKECAGLYCSMKPGITGLWQVGKRSDTEDYNERVKLDTWYVLNHSFWLDIRIILRTILSILSGKGAC